jgi:hypothetical protein
MKQLCDETGCTRSGTELVACFLPDGDDKPENYYCIEHCQQHGYCWGCGYFWSGNEFFDFNPSGLCQDCSMTFAREDHDEDDETDYSDELVRGEGYGVQG